jgi:hypothetical protein
MSMTTCKLLRSACFSNMISKNKREIYIQNNSSINIPNRKKKVINILRRKKYSNDIILLSND